MGWAFNDSDFNKDISQWDVSNVTDMQNMFAYSSFNKPLNWRLGRF
jgi:surface protein